MIAHVSSQWKKVQKPTYVQNITQRAFTKTLSKLNIYIFTNWYLPINYPDKYNSLSNKYSLVISTDK